MVDVYAVSRLKRPSPELSRLEALGLETTEPVPTTDLLRGSDSEVYEHFIGSWVHWSAICLWLENNWAVSGLYGKETFSADEAGALAEKVGLVLAGLDPARDADWVPTLEILHSALLVAADSGIMFIA